MMFHNDYHICKRFFGSGFFPDNYHEQLGYQYTTDLHLNGILTIAPEVTQREILFVLLEQ